ncbi:hypothetical protein GCM10009716_37800 [Streptomyces sodiiphilus]|uniref:Uncharacterized protein n=1 Tax=Streptomyces sodiiphilus TaxID=226217 RepID=A0ABP5AYV5_9ACTN
MSVTVCVFGHLPGERGDQRARSLRSERRLPSVTRAGPGSHGWDCRGPAAPGQVPAISCPEHPGVNRTWPIARTGVRASRTRGRRLRTGAAPFFPVVPGAGR